MNGADTCDLCANVGLVPIYRAESTQRDLTVHVCSVCGLVQSLPRIDHVDKYVASPSSDAAFGNLRYGKQFSIPRLISLFKKQDIVQPVRCLDVGAGRGWVAKALDKMLIVQEMWCVEPDPNLTNPNGKWKWIQGRIENVEFPTAFFDVAVMIHTLEHLASPKAALKQINEAMLVGGWLYVEVPNLMSIGNGKHVTEFFIDKHCYFFDFSTLSRLIETCGFEIVEQIVDGDDLVVMCRKPKEDSKAFCDVIALLDKYNDGRKKLNDAVQQNVAVLNGMLAKGVKVGVWGAGRILDAYRVAGFNVKDATVVDLYVPETDLSVSRKPEDLLPCHYVMIMSSTYRTEMVKSLCSLKYEGLIEHWDGKIPVY